MYQFMMFFTERFTTQLPSLDQLDAFDQQPITYMSSPMFVASVFTFIIFVLALILMNNRIKDGKEPSEILKTFGIPLIVVSSVFIVITGLEMTKLTPVIGLLGTIAGYLLGRQESSKKELEDRKC
ncbi:MAG: hypothetical protein IE880_00220 [Epsilonproteobacteria bacterium]|nr:hypothetical protein [Campylobacterota bacterium]